MAQSIAFPVAEPVRLNRKQLMLTALWWFAFLGPLGRIIALPGAPLSLRGVYLFLPLGVVFLVLAGVSRRGLNNLVSMLPLAVYLCLSAIRSIYTNSVQNDDFSAGENPFSRLAVLMLLAVMAVLGGDALARCSASERFSVVKAFFIGFAVSVVEGYILVGGYYVGVVPYRVLEMTHVLVQFGWGVLRFSPGSYPNEYGIVSSFGLTMLSLAIIHRAPLLSMKHTWRLALFWGLCALALFLTTTRAAYIACIGSHFFLVLQCGLYGPKQWLDRIAAIGARLAIVTVVVVTLASAVVDMPAAFAKANEMIVEGTRSILKRDGNIAARFDQNDVALRDFQRQPILGTGYSTFSKLHNTYFQFLVEEGLLGTLLVAMPIAVMVAGTMRRHPALPRTAIDSEALFLSRTAWHAIWHVLWFACSNHTLNHHLTWFTVMIAIGLANPAKPDAATANPEQRLPSGPGSKRQP